MGLKHGTISAFGASSGCGKSTYMVGTLMSLAAKGEKVILVSNESQISDVRIQFLVWILTRCLDYWKISKKKLTSGNLTDEDRVKIKEARKQINEIDKEMAKLFEKRMDAARLVAEYKAENALPVFDPERERELFEKNFCIETKKSYLIYKKEGEKTHPL